MVWCLNKSALIPYRLEHYVHVTIITIHNEPISNPKLLFYAKITCDQLLQTDKEYEYCQRTMNCVVQ